MKLSIVKFIELNIDQKIAYLKENNISIHPFLWMLFSDGLKNNISVIQSIIGQKYILEPPQALSIEEMKKIIDRCEVLGTNINKIEMDLVDKVKEEEYG